MTDEETGFEDSDLKQLLAITVSSGRLADYPAQVDAQIQEVQELAVAAEHAP